MSIWCYSRWERLWGSGQIRKRGGSSRCWRRMMYCCSLWDSDNTSTKVEQGNREKIDPFWCKLGWKPDIFESEHFKKTNMFPGPTPSPLFYFQICLLKHHFRFDLFYINLSLEVLHTSSPSFCLLSGSNWKYLHLSFILSNTPQRQPRQDSTCKWPTHKRSATLRNSNHFFFSFYCNTSKIFWWCDSQSCYPT